ncbi:MAG: M48 family metallopeptidase [Pseudomonadota bacterium]
MEYAPKDISDASNPNVTSTHPLKELAVLLAGVLGCILGVYVILGIAVDWVVPRISMQTEEKLAAIFIPSGDGTPNRSETVRKLQTLADDIQLRCAHLPYEITVDIADSPMINAMALPGGRIMVTSGLLDKIESENELAFVLGHEMGHYANRDHLRGFGRALILMVVSTALFGADSSVSSFIGSAVNVTEMNFSRSQENLADEFGLGTLHCAYGHVTGATDFFEKIPTENDPGKFGHYFASHPENEKRIAHLNDLGKEKNYAAGERIRWGKTDKLTTPKM